MKTVLFIVEVLFLTVFSMSVMAQSSREGEVFVISDAGQCVHIDSADKALCLSSSSGVNNTQSLQLTLGDDVLINFPVNTNKPEVGLSEHQRLVVVKQVKRDTSVLSVYSFESEGKTIHRLRRIFEINEPYYNHIEHIDDNGDIVYALTPGEHTGCNRYEVEKRNGRISHTDRCVTGINAFTKKPVSIALPHLCFQFER